MEVLEQLIMHRYKRGWMGVRRAMHDRLRTWYWATPLAHWRHRNGQIKAISALIQPGMTVVDVGADVGLYTFAFADAVGRNGRVLAFEPHPASHGILRYALTVRPRSWVSLYQLALGEFDEDRRLLTPNSSHGRPLPPFSFVQPNDQSPTGNETPAGYPISVRQLDLLASDQQIDFLKIDVEGYELEVLRGASKILETHRPKIFVEIEQQHHARYHRRAETVFDFLDANGYSSHRAVEQNVTPGNYLFLPHTP